MPKKLSLEVEAETKLVAALIEVLDVDVRRERYLNTVAQTVCETETERALVVDFRAERSISVDGVNSSDAELSGLVSLIPVDRESGLKIWTNFVENRGSENFAIVHIRVENDVIVGVTHRKVALRQVLLRRVESKLKR